MTRREATLVTTPFTYRVEDLRNNTTTYKVAKSYRYLSWMWYHVYAFEAKAGSMLFDQNTEMWVITLR